MNKNLEIMNFLFERTCFIIITAESKQKFGTYIPDKNVTILGRGTGVLLEHNCRAYVVTNDHVIWRHRNKDQHTTIHIGLEDKKPFTEYHDGYAFAAREFLDDGNGFAKLNDCGNPIPKDPLNNIDLALVRLSPTSFKAAQMAGRKFICWSDVYTQTLNVGDEVFFRGYPKENVDYIHDRNSFGVDGYSLFTTISRIEGKRIVIDSTEEGIFTGMGKVEPNRVLHGISGAGLFNKQKRLIGIVYGGDPDKKEIFACSINEISPLLEKFK